MVKPKRSLLERIFLSEDRRLAAPAATPGAEDAGSSKQEGMETKTDLTGTAGTLVENGYPSEEYLAKLRGKSRADIIDQMRRSDPQIVMVLQAVKNPIKSALWEIEPGAGMNEQPTPEAIADADLIRHMLFSDMARPWSAFLGEALTMIDFGFAVFEITHKVVENHPKFGTYNGLASLGFRSQRTIEKWNLDKETGLLASVTQIATGDLAITVDIPDVFLLTMALNKEGSNYEGISMLRPCYGSYMRKDLYLKLNAIGIEKHAVGTPIATLPSDKIGTTEADNMVAALENYISHESNFLLIPEGWTVSISNNSYDPEKVESSVDREDVRIAKAFLANFLELGSGGGGGSYALSNDQSDFMLSGLEHIANEIESSINQDLIPSLIKMNRGPRDFYPRLKHSGISDKAGAELGTLLNALSTGKWLTPEDGDEVHLRRRIGLPDRTGKGERLVGAPVLEAAPEETQNETEQSAVGEAAPAGEQPTKVADSALNGAQVASLVEIVSMVVSGQIPRDSAIQIIQTAFLVDAAKAEEIMASAGGSFKPPAAPAAAPAPGLKSVAASETLAAMKLAEASQLLKRARELANG